MEYKIEREMDYYKLTQMQKKIWDAEKSYPKTPIQNIGGAVLIKGEINLEILEKAIQIFINRNDGIRLRFLESDGEPYQYVFPYKSKKLDFIDFSNVINPQEEFEKWSSDTFSTAFELEDSDLYYFGLFRISNKENGVLLRIHHIICDGWGTSIIQNGILEKYYKLMKNEVINTTPSPSFIDFIAKEDKYIKSFRFLKDKEYWNEKFSNISDISEEFLYNGTDDVKGKRSVFNLDDNQSLKIKEFLEEKRIPMNTFFLVVMGLYLNKKTQKEDIIIGDLIYNRLSKKDRETVGMCISKIPVKLTINKEKSISDFMSEVSFNIKGDFYHQRYPYHELVKDLNISKRGYSNLYRYSINCYNANYLNDIGDDNTVESLEYYNGYQHSSLQVIIKEVKDNKIVLYFDRIISEYTEEEINDMYEYMIYIALQITDNSDKNIKEIVK